MATRNEVSTYKNPWHKPNNPILYGPEYYTTDAKPQDYKGYLIYERITGNVWDVVKDGVFCDLNSVEDYAKKALK